jgi:hypothetical protein
MEDLSARTIQALIDRFRGEGEGVTHFSPPPPPKQKKDSLSIEDQHTLKIIEIASHFERVFSYDRPTKLAFIKMVLNYEWDYEVEKIPCYKLQTVLTIIDNNEDLFPITVKLEQMLREIHPIMDDAFVTLRYNENLLDLCNDVGLLNQNSSFHSLTLSANPYLLLKKGMPCRDQDKYSLYIKSVMITT